MFEPEHCSRPVADLVAAASAACAAGVPTPEIVLGADTKALLVLKAQVESLVAARLSIMAGRGLADVEGRSSVASWAAAEALVHPSETTALKNVGREAEALPAMAALFAAGSVTARHVRVVARAVAGLDEELRARGDAFLAEQAVLVHPSDFGRAAEAWRQTVVPGISDEETERQRVREFFSASRTLDGAVRVDGLLFGLNAEALMTALDRFAKPVPFDQRTPAQRRADAIGLSSRIAAGADIKARDLQGTEYQQADLPPLRVTVLTDLVTLQRALEAAEQRAQQALAEPAWGGAGWLPATERELVTGAVGERSGSPVDWRSLVSAFCDAELSRLVLGPDSEVLDLGRRVRLFTAAQRRALAKGRVRCVIPKCDSPWVEADHIEPWAAGGPTDLSNGRLPCTYHHTLIHQGWRIVVGESGRTRFIPPPDWEHRRLRRTRRPRVS